MGKTRLVTELAVRVTANGRRVLSGGRLPVGEGSLPYAPIVESVRPLPGELGAESKLLPEGNVRLPACHSPSKLSQQPPSSPYLHPP